MTETQQRFLRAIAERVPMDQVVELHLFPPIRQGGVETGVAVVAEDPRRPEPNVDSMAGTDAATETADVDAAAPERATAGVTEMIAVPDDAEPSPYADDPEEPPSDPGADAVAETDGAGTNGHVPAPRVRLTIHTARYRLTLKGVDRGKWEVDVVAEADAPLDAIDAVIRGVQRRAGEGSEPDRLNAEAFRGALEAPLATLER
jgi:hypothetical protein